MPMIVVGTEKNFAALRPRLFEGKVSTAASKDVVASIEAANPGINLSRLEPGTVINVPDSPHVSVRGDLSLDDATKSTLAGLSDAGASALVEITAAAQSREAADAADRKKLAQSLTGKQVTDAAKDDKAIAAGLKAAKDALAEEDDRAKARATALQQAQAEWSAELAALKDIVG